MVNSEENMTNLEEDKTRVTVGDSRTLTKTNRGYWNEYQRRDRKLHRAILSNMAIISVLSKN